MTARFDLYATRNTTVSALYPSQAAADAASSPLIALGYSVNLRENGPDFELNANLYESFFATYPTEAAAHTASTFYLDNGYLVSIHETVEVQIPPSLLYSPSKHRSNAVALEGAYITSGMLVAIFVTDAFPSTNITQIDFKLDTVLVNTELASPWDYGTTDGFGDAIRVTLPVGLHLVEAVVTDDTGTYTISANIEVE